MRTFSDGFVVGIVTVEVIAFWLIVVAILTGHTL